MEHRWGQRTQFDVPVWLRLHSGSPDDSLFAARIINASVSGALLHTPIDLPLLSLLDVFIVDEAIPACVVRQAASDTYGIEWRDLAPQILSALCLTTAAAPWVGAQAPRLSASRAVPIESRPTVSAARVARAVS